jgi:SAM-dependent methyltransferase
VNKPMPHEDRWTAYYDAHAGREPRPLLLEVLDTFDAPGQAVELGFGNGIETIAMLKRGWRVLAIDPEPEASERLMAGLPDDGRERLRTVAAPMEDVELPTTDLVWAAFSLFFCDPARFPEVWARIREAVRPGGRFAGQLLGEHDTWAGDEGVSAFERDEAIALFDDGWRIDRFEEEENDGEAISGPKHWHLFNAVATRGRDLG